MLTSKDEHDFVYVATCIRHRVSGFNCLTGTMMSPHLYKLIYRLTLLQTCLTWKHVIGSKHMVLSLEKKLLWNLIFLRHYQTKLCLAHDLKCAPGTLMKCIWITIDILSKMKIVSNTHVCMILNDDQYLLVNIE